MKETYYYTPPPPQKRKKIYMGVGGGNIFFFTLSIHPPVCQSLYFCLWDLEFLLFFLVEGSNLSICSISPCCCNDLYCLSINLSTLSIGSSGGSSGSDFTEACSLVISRTFVSATQASSSFVGTTVLIPHLI